VLFRNMMFRGKATLVVEKEFGYPAAANAITRRVLRDVCSQMRKNGANEYDAAIAFMFVQIDALSRRLETLEFRLKHAKTAVRLSEFAAEELTKKTALQLLEEIEDERY